MSTELSTLTGKSNFFEDFAIGDVFEHARGKTVEDLENVLITNLVLNTAQAHFNEDFAQSLEQKHRITFGGVTASIVIGLAMQDTGENAVEEVGLDQVRFRVPVLHGDTLYAFTEVVNKEEEPTDSRGHKNVGLVHFRHWGVNQRGETVFEGERRVLIKKRAYVAEALKDGEETISTETTKSQVRRVSQQKRASGMIAKTRVAKRVRMKPKMARPSKPSPVKPRRGRR
ncbi:MAG: MaoC family dehydratase [Deltaproteobacteria bacterium]|nr:MaoC family dehydratase [Deltaproteobacteria bacterium]